MMAQVRIGGGRVVCEMDEAAQDEYKQVVGWLQKAIAERDAAREEAAALRAALVSVIDGKSEFDIEYDTGMPTDEARRIINLAYNRQ